MKKGFTFKMCNIKGVTYIQIWQRNDRGNFYVRSCGTADQLQKNLVRLEELEKQTKEVAENLTKISEGKNNEKD